MTQEKDPNGKSLHEPGAKADAGKIRPGLVFRSFARALWEVAEVGTYGAKKYSDDGWLSVPKASERYEDADLRHMLKRWMGEECDKDTDILHLAHQAWNALAKLELALRAKETANAHPIFDSAEARN